MRGVPSDSCLPVRLNVGRGKPFSDMLPPAGLVSATGGVCLPWCCVRASGCSGPCGNAAYACLIYAMSCRAHATLPQQAAPPLTVGLVLHRRWPTADHLCVKQGAETVPLAVIAVLALLVSGRAGAHASRSASSSSFLHTATCQLARCLVENFNLLIIYPSFLS